VNAALRQICCCSYKGDIRVREDAMCPVHGLDQKTRERLKLEGEVLALREGVRDCRTDAMTAIHRYRSAKRKLTERLARLEAM
jgi:hypothetical protein